jgi:adenosylcobinamide-phosphate synthase
MAAMALRLAVVLAKPGHYALNAGGAAPASHDVDEALGVARRTAVVAVSLAAAAEFLIRPRRGGHR